MGDTLIKILDEKTALVKNKDLFYLDMPLGAIGLWFSDAQTDSRFNGVDIKEFDIYYRGKTKSSCIDNIKYVKDTIDNMTLETCKLNDGTNFRLEIMFNWDFLEKDSEGYFVFANRVSLIL